MCELDFDVIASVWKERLIVAARKERRCATCSTTIAIGESYMSHFSVFEGDASHESQCVRCRTISDAFQREHLSMVTPGSLFEFLDQCLDEERWLDAVDDDDLDESDRPRNRLPSRLSDEGLRWKFALVEIRARNAAAREAA